jgi:hypothetical protein
MTYIAITFFFDGSPWEVKLPICPNCTEDSPAL